MKILNASIVLGSLMTIATLPTMAGQPVSLSPSNVPVRLAAENEPTAGRSSYTQHARDQVQEWQRKLHDFSEQAKTKSQTAGSSAGNELDEAWHKTEAASHRLQTASADGWESAKTSFEKASREMADTWHRIHPEAQ